MSRVTNAVGLLRSPAASSTSSAWTAAQPLRSRSRAIRLMSVPGSPADARSISGRRELQLKVALPLSPLPPTLSLCVRACLCLPTDRMISSWRRLLASSAARQISAAIRTTRCRRAIGDTIATLEMPGRFSAACGAAVLLDSAAVAESAAADCISRETTWCKAAPSAAGGRSSSPSSPPASSAAIDRGHRQSCAYAASSQRTTSSVTSSVTVAAGASYDRDTDADAGGQ